LPPVITSKLYEGMRVSKILWPDQPMRRGNHVCRRQRFPEDASVQDNR